MIAETYDLIRSAGGELIEQVILWFYVFNVFQSHELVIGLSANCFHFENSSTVLKMRK